MDARTLLMDMASNNVRQATRMLDIREGGMALWHLKEAVKQLELASLNATSPLEVAAAAVGEQTGELPGKWIFERGTAALRPDADLSGLPGVKKTNAVNAATLNDSHGAQHGSCHEGAA